MLPSLQAPSQLQRFRLLAVATLLHALPASSITEYSGGDSVTCGVGDSVAVHYPSNDSWVNTTITGFDDQFSIVVLSWGDGQMRARLDRIRIQKDGQACQVRTAKCDVGDSVRVSGTDVRIIQSLNSNGTITVHDLARTLAVVEWRAVQKDYALCRPSPFLQCAEGDHVVYRDTSEPRNATIRSVYPNGSIMVEWSGGRATVDPPRTAESLEKDGVACPEFGPVDCLLGDRVQADGRNATIKRLDTSDGNMIVEYDDDVEHSAPVLWSRVLKDERRCATLIPSAPCEVGDHVVALYPLIWLGEVASMHPGTILSFLPDGCARVAWDQVEEKEFDDRPRVNVGKNGVVCPPVLPASSPLSSATIVMIALGSLAFITLGALLAVRCCRKRAQDGTDNKTLLSLARRLNDASESRAMNRWGMGVDLPSAGERVFFGAGFVPTLSASESIAAFDVFGDNRTMEMRALAQQKTQEMGKSGLTLVCDHVELIMSFTEESDLYVLLLKACRTTGKGSEKMLDRYRDYLYHLQTALSNLPPYVGRTFRSIDVQVEAASYQVGSTITWQAPSSASRVECMVTDFMRVVEEEAGRGQTHDSQTRLFGTIFVIESTSGKDICMCSAFPEEKEVVFHANSHFRVSARLESDVQKRRTLSSPTWSNFDLSQVVVILLQQI